MCVNADNSVDVRFIIQAAKQGARCSTAQRRIRRQHDDGIN
jgi:hypothetical protein